MSEKKNENFRIVARNKKARFNYEIVETFEAGIVLAGSEVKSIRNGRVSINEAFAGPMEGAVDLYLFNSDISIYEQASYNNHEPRRPRILLLHRAQRIKLLNAVQKKGMTITPLTMYFNHNGILKVSIALARGKNVVDKRESIKERDWNIEKLRSLKKFS
jgi:SsrA-binding protein